MVLLGLLVLAWLALGPWALAAAALLLAVPRVRDRVLDRVPWPRRPWRTGGIAAGVLVALAGVVVLVPDGWLPVPSTGGLLATPSYVGRQVSPRPLSAQAPTQNPWLVAHDPTAPGPVGDQPEVDTAWYGLEACGTLLVDSRGRLVASCRDRRGRILRVLDPDSLRPLVSRRLAGGDCEADHLHLDNTDRAVVTTGDGRVQVISTADADGEPDLTVTESWDLDGSVPAGDCLVGVAPDWAGRLWWVTGEGRVGILDPVTGTVRSLDLGEPVGHAPAVDESGVFVVTDSALVRVGVDHTDAVAVAWRTEYDRGVERKSGQPDQGSGSPPVLVGGGLVALTDNAEPRMHVLLVDRATGEQVCRSAVFDGGESATDGALVAVGAGVVVANTHGYDSPSSALLGFTPSGGLARIEQAEGTCRVVWTSDEVAPSSVPAVSWGSGLVYAWTKRPSVWGVPAWYLTAVDVHTGRTAFSVRSGTGMLHDGAGAAVALGPDGSAYAATLAGLVRVRDRDRS